MNGYFFRPVEGFIFPLLTLKKIAYNFLSCNAQRFDATWSIFCISYGCLPADEHLLAWGLWGAMEGRSYSFFVCCSVQFHTGIVLALNWKDHLRAEASRSLEIMQPAVSLSQEAERNLGCSR